MMNLILKRKATLTSIVATSLISVASPAPATSPISFLDIPIDSIVSIPEGQHKETIERSQLLVKQRHRDHEMFIVRTPDRWLMSYTKIHSLNIHGKSDRQLFPVGVQGLDRGH
ncbi:MAG: hypothetical protein MUE44_17520 [Oscillatoriaceae cyanobacterium Prado104]|jgi:hypothetical protein|nr:hypothetical protein [Oscillatoriaceae cyanobacterium Prado104]